jgi:Lsr2
MGHKVEITLLDDLDSSPAAETVTFALDGVTYEIDLSAKHARELRSGLDKYVEAAQKLTPYRHLGLSGRRRPAVVGNGVSNQAVREWAAVNGLDVAAHGRIPASVLEQYQQHTASGSGNGRRRRG